MQCLTGKNTDSHCWKPQDTDFAVQPQNKAYKNTAKITQKFTVRPGGRRTIAPPPNTPLPLQMVQHFLRLRNSYWVCGTSIWGRFPTSDCCKICSQLSETYHSLCQSREQTFWTFVCNISLLLITNSLQSYLRKSTTVGEWRTRSSAEAEKREVCLRNTEWSKTVSIYWINNAWCQAVRAQRHAWRHAYKI